MLTWGTLLKQTAQTAIDQIFDKLGWKIMAAVLLIAIVLFGTPFLMHSHSSTAEVKSLIFAGLENVDQLTTVTMDAKATVKVEKPNEILGVQVGQTNFVYEGVSKVQAGINLKELQVRSISSDRRTVHLVLPAPYIREVGLDVGHSTILANYRDWFATRATPELQEVAQLKAMAIIKQQACASQILEAANRSATSLLTEVLTRVGFKEVQIDTQLPSANVCQR